MQYKNTIAAITTAPGEAGISVVRISGAGSLSIADKIFRSSGKKPSEMDAGSFQYGHIYSDTSDLDEVILLVYHAPHSYTCEDVVEIQGHGGRVSSRRILRAVLQAGAKPAEPGEFTKRAFLNGRIDLIQAEAVLDMIQADTDRAATAAIEQLEGNLSSSFNAIYDRAITASADLTVIMDFDEGELDDNVITDVIKRLSNVKIDAKKLLATWDEGHLLREGAKVVISGQPNVGKSTLLNKLLGNERSIVTHIAGTTRDTIEEELIINGIAIRLIDTAGLRDVDCIVEQQGIERAHNSMQNADLLLYMLDSSKTSDDNDLENLTRSGCDSTIVVVNKVDIMRRIDLKKISNFTIIETSLLNDQGVEEIKAAISSKLDFSTNAKPHAVISERHYSIVQSFLNELNDVVSMLLQDSETMLVPAASTLHNAIETLGTATGRTYSKDLLDNVFNRFCIGK